MHLFSVLYLAKSNKLQKKKQSIYFMKFCEKGNNQILFYFPREISSSFFLFYFFNNIYHMFSMKCAWNVMQYGEQSIAKIRKMISFWTVVDSGKICKHLQRSSQKDFVWRCYLIGWKLYYEDITSFLISTKHQSLTIGTEPTFIITSVFWNWFKLSHLDWSLFDVSSMTSNWKNQKLDDLSLINLLLKFTKVFTWYCMIIEYLIIDPDIHCFIKPIKILMK